MKNFLFYLPKCTDRNYIGYIKEIRKSFICDDIKLIVASEEMHEGVDISFECYNADIDLNLDQLKINFTKIVSANRFWTNFSEVEIWPYVNFDESIIERITKSN